MAENERLVEPPPAQALYMQGHRDQHIRYCNCLMCQVMVSQGGKSSQDMHFSPVLENFDCFSHRLPVPDNSPGLLKMPMMPQTIAADVVFSPAAPKRFAADRTEGRLNETDVLPACPAVRNSMVPLESPAAAQT